MRRRGGHFDGPLSGYYFFFVAAFLAGAFFFVANGLTPFHVRWIDL